MKWYRVFGASDVQPEPAALLEKLHDLGFAVTTVRFHGDDQGWFKADLLFPQARTPLRLERYLAAEEGIRHELNTWAAWVETQAGNAHQDRLMQHLIGTKQVFTVQVETDEDDEPVLPEKLFVALCQALARVTDGVYQADGKGFFAADGSRLIEEDGWDPPPFAPRLS